MPLFGEKRFKKAQKEEINVRLNQSPPSSLVSGASKNKDLHVDHSSIVALANKIFGFNGWSHSVIHQSIDFIESDGDKYDVGVSALVKVMLKDGTFHEDIGYGVSKGLKCKGSSISKARRAAACDGLKNALSAFGKGVGGAAATGKITDFLQPTEVLPKKANATLSSVKRKLVPEFDNVSDQNKRLSCSQPCAAIPGTSSQTTLALNSPVLARSILFSPVASSPVIQRTKRASAAHDTPSTTTDDSILASPLGNNDNDSIPSTPTSLRKYLSQAVSDSNGAIDSSKVKKKLKQLVLEIKSRQEALAHLQAHISDSPEVYEELYQNGVSKWEPEF